MYCYENVMFLVRVVVNSDSSFNVEWWHNYPHVEQQKNIVQRSAGQPPDSSPTDSRLQSPNTVHPFVETLWQDGLIRSNSETELYCHQMNISYFEIFMDSHRIKVFYYTDSGKKSRQTFIIQLHYLLLSLILSKTLNVLKKELKVRGLSAVGNKTELVERLQLSLQGA